MYKLSKDPISKDISVVNKIMEGRMLSIPFDPANTDYVNFKREILADEAQLQDADGNLMSPEAAKEFVKGLV